MLVVWGHFAPVIYSPETIPNVITYFIYCFHIPLFFFISGYSALYQKVSNSFKDILLKSINSIMLAILMGIGLIVIYITSYNVDIGKSLLMQAMTSNWFLLTLATISIMTYFFRYYKMNIRMVLLISLFGALLTGLLVPVVSKLFLYFFFYLLGILCKKGEFKIDSRKLVLALMFFIPFSIWYGFHTDWGEIVNIYAKYSDIRQYPTINR